MTSKRTATLRFLATGKMIMESDPTVNYLGLMLDREMSFLEQIKTATGREA